KLVVFLALFLPGAWLAAQWWAGALGPEPLKEAIHEAGLWAVRLTLVALAVTPLRFVAAWPRVLLLRRMLGLAALAYALLHLGLFAADQGFDPWRVAREIALRIYLTIGFVTLAGLGVLGWTSTDGWMRRLGTAWGRLHRLIYLIAALALFHFFLQSKADVSEAVLTAGLFLWLMLWRAQPMAWRGRLWPLPGLAPLAAAATAAVEYAWYALATNLPAERVLAANLDLTFGPRPAVWVGIAGLGVAALGLARRVTLRRR
ncbi:MAG TPA: ferric reductase-like transmembrane domain-containing protein, partial [Crenalkalicoccus sp.]|nr:ferric reductase-like transmembrane domain-containing protein [Crenalkalicoccus sp.]